MNLKKDDGDDRLYEDVRYELADLTKAFLVGTYETLKSKPVTEEHLDELESLSNTYGFEVVGKEPCTIRKIDAGTYLGKGKLNELVSSADALGADIIIFDDDISPNQQRNIEKFFKRPVIDRTELILEVFAQRAHSKEARLQIELAKTQYQLPRLKRLWTHLSRQAGTAGGGSSGGGGYLKGEGERQIEIDRRILKKRISSLRRQLKELHERRKTQRAQRIRSGVPLFAIVGYTNAGKSTLLNALTNAGVLMEDKLFATLETTARKFTLPNHQPIVLIDTVGFIRKIPHNIVEAFKSTLEEAVYTDILVHIIDVSHPMAEEHAKATHEVLKELGAEDKPIITVLNKIDKCENKANILKFKLNYPKTVQISALNKDGFDQLSKVMIQELSSIRERVKLKVPQSQYSLVSEIIENGHVEESEYVDNDIVMIADVPKVMMSKIEEYIIK